MAHRALCVLLLLACLCMASGRRDVGRKTQQPTAAACKANIRSCRPGSCIMKGASVVCQACKDGYVKSTGGLHCICPAGSWEQCSNGNCRCTQCEAGFYCPGGSRTAKNRASAAERGGRFSCHGQEPDKKSTTVDMQAKGVTTEGPGTKRAAECMPMPGYSMPEGATQAFPCPPGTYSSGGSRVSSCTPCPNGLAEDPSSSSNGFIRASKEKVCMVPSGMYLEDGWTWNCTLGHFRSGYVPAGAAAANSCFACPKGTTTKQEGSAEMKDCNVAMPGYNINADSVSGQSDDLGSADPEPCPKGTYFEGGDIPGAGLSTCQPCPLGTTTREVGSTSMSDCGVPPGYYVNILSGSLAKCPMNISDIGYYRSDWANWDEASVQDTDGTKACTPCGPGILSDWIETDERDSTNTSFVAASSDSCYIKAGWGMQASPDRDNHFTASICGNGTYSMHSESSYGLWHQPCVPCFQHQITLRLGAINYTECTNAAGWGFNAENRAVVACRTGFWNPAGSYEPCKPCPTGRTTDINPEDPDTAQDSADDCIVNPGWGIKAGLDATGTAADASLPVEECPIGFYSPGGQIDTKCIPCDAGYTTPKTGIWGTDNSACTKCVAGYGREDSSTPMVCKACDYGRHQIGYNGWGGLDHAGDGEICLTCPSTKYAYVSSKGKLPSDILDSEGITFTQGATTIDACTPRLGQQLIHAGQTWSLPDRVFTSSDKGSVAECAALCRSKSDGGMACFAQYDYATSECRTGVLPPASTGSAVSAKLLVKLIPSGIVSGTVSAVGAVGQGAELGSFMGSGFLGAISGEKTGLYRHLDISSFTPEDQARMGAPIVDSQGNVWSTNLSESVPLARCTAMCDAEQSCWAVTVIGDVCTLRTGGIHLDVRSLFVQPKPGTVPGF